LGEDREASTNGEGRSSSGIEDGLENGGFDEGEAKKAKGVDENCEACVLFGLGWFWGCVVKKGLEARVRVSSSWPRHWCIRIRFI
jgi:hypothetical protein